MKILGIETSCDETSAAVVENGGVVLSNVIHSQIDIHRVYGGVVPEIASRNHVAKVDEVVRIALEDASCKIEDIDAIAVTYGPGLVGALLVGLNFAKALAFATDTPLVAVNHLEGHIASAYLENPDWKPPFVTLITSGGHCHLVHVGDYCPTPLGTAPGNFETLGKTHDDAAGEAFDKVARTLGLSYPGGIEIDRLAKSGNPHAIAFPRAKLDKPLDFSFSGIKSAVLNYLNAAKMKGEEIIPADVAASFQEAVVDTLTQKAIKACQTKNTFKLAIVGGVACNSRLRTLLTEQCEKEGIELHIPKPIYCTDNAAMIAAAGYYQYKAGRLAPLSLNAVPSLRL